MSSLSKIVHEHTPTSPCVHAYNVMHKLYDICMYGHIYAFFKAMESIGY